MPPPLRIVEDIFKDEYWSGSGLKFHFNFGQFVLPQLGMTQDTPPPPPPRGGGGTWHWVWDLRTTFAICTLSWGGIFSPFMQIRSVDLLAQDSGCTLLFNPILLYVYQHRSLTAIGQKKAYSHSKVFARDTRNRDTEKSSGQTHLFNIWTIGALDRTSGLPQVKLNLLHSIFLNIRSLYIKCYTHREFTS